MQADDRTITGHERHQGPVIQGASWSFKTAYRRLDYNPSIGTGDPETETLHERTMHAQSESQNPPLPAQSLRKLGYNPRPAKKHVLHTPQARVVRVL